METTHVYVDNTKYDLLRSTVLFVEITGGSENKLRCRVMIKQSTRTSTRLSAVRQQSPFGNTLETAKCTLPD